VFESQYFEYANVGTIVNGDIDKNFRKHQFGLSNVLHCRVHRGLLSWTEGSMVSAGAIGGLRKVDAYQATIQKCQSGRL
jgi:hypothetical protein